jgi:ferrochelatase
MKTAVLVMAYGGPDSLADIEPYLLDVRGGRPVSPEFLAEVTQRYARIGGRSPLLELTRAQAAGLENALNSLSPNPSPDSGKGERAYTSGPDGVPGFRVYVGMRHWKPYIREAVAQMAANGFQEVVAFCMTPHASAMSTGAYLKKLREAVAASQAPLNVNFIESWHDQPFLVHSLARKINLAAHQFPTELRPQVHYLFTAHSLPASIVAQGDPYPNQLLETARLLAAELGLKPEQWSFGYQSAGAAPGAWLGPSIEDILPRMAGEGVKNILVTPVGFMADHVEVLYDLDIEAQEIAAREGIHLVRSESLNASPDFIAGLAKFIFERMTTKNYEAV